MTREQLAHLLRLAASVADDEEVIVVDSQAILGSYEDNKLREPAHPLDRSGRLLHQRPGPHEENQTHGAPGEDSASHEMFGYYAQGVDVTTATLQTPGGRSTFETRPLSAESCWLWFRVSDAGDVSALDPYQRIQPAGATPGEPLPQLEGVKSVSAPDVAGEIGDSCQVGGTHGGWLKR